MEIEARARQAEAQSRQAQARHLPLAGGASAKFARRQRVFNRVVLEVVCGAVVVLLLGLLGH